jgi:glutamate synthase (NADPH/NADH) small chain
MNTLSPKERMKIPRQLMPHLESDVRIRSFNEVNLGFTEELAMQEALRCLQCPKPACVEGCPVGIKINEFIRLITEGDYLGAASRIKEDNILPSVCGRVCPQEEQCEAKCVIGKKTEPVAIGRLERFVADYERSAAGIRSTARAPASGKRVAVVGSGPAGLSCAADLSIKGHDVTVFEALHELGGVLLYGIPEFRLPKTVLQAEIDSLRALGVQFRTNTVVGLTDTVDELFEQGFDAVFVAVGAGLPHFLNIQGENLIGVYSANEFLTRVNLMRAYRFPESDTPVFDFRDREVIVFGGGNTAMDAVRTAKRLGARRAFISYRRSEAEMPARKEELLHAKEEGIEFLNLTAPLEFVGDEQGWLKKIRMIRMQLGEIDRSGRRSPEPIPGSEFGLEVSFAIVAIGNGSNPILQRTTPDLEFNARGNIKVDPDTMRTSRKGVFAGGDIVTGGATVILAMGAGRQAAAAIDDYLKGVQNGEGQTTT